MKKLLSCALAIMLLFAVALPVFAADDDFVPSVAAKAAPAVAVVGDANGTAVAAADVKVVALKDAAADSDLKKAYDELKAGDLEKLMEGVKDMTVKELLDVSLTNDAANTALEGDGTTLTLNFKLGVAAGVEVKAFTHNDGKWNPVAKCENKGDGSVDVTFEHFCPVAFLVPTSSLNTTTTPVAPSTGDNNNLMIWGAVMILAVAGIAVLVVSYRRKAVKG